MLFVTLVTMVALATIASPDQPAPSVGDDGGEYVLEQITPRAYYLRQRIGVREAPSGNVAIFEQSDGYVVVDTGLTHRGGERIADHIVALGGEKPVKAIIITHWHGDHSLGAAGLIRRWPAATLISSHHTREEMANRYSDQYPLRPGSEELRAYRALIEESRSALARRAGGAAFPQEMAVGRQRAFADLDRLLRERPGQTLVLPSLTFADRLTLHDPEYPLDLLFLGRANTEGDIVVWAPEDRIVATGDIVVWPMPYAFGSHPAEWVQALERLRGLDFAHLVPGHGELQRNADYVARLARLIGETERQVTALLDQGVARDAIPQRLQIEGDVEAFAGADPYHRSLFERYFIEPMIENVLRGREDGREEGSR